MPRIEQILAEEEALKADSSTLLWKHGAYVDYLLGYGLFLREELPDEAVQLYDLNHYEGEVMNGGHAQYLGNLDRWKQIPGPLADSCLAGLSHVPNAEYRAIYEQLVERLAQDRARAASIASTFGFSDLGTGYSDSIIKQLDKRFFQINKGHELGQANAQRLKGLDNLRAVPWKEFLPELILQIVGNPNRLKRRADKGLRPFTFMVHFDGPTVESICQSVGLKFDHAILGGFHRMIGDQMMYGHVIETDGQRCFVCFRRPTEKLRPLHEYRGEPIYLYSFPANQLLASTSPLH